MRTQIGSNVFIDIGGTGYADDPLSITIGRFLNDYTADCEDELDEDIEKAAYVARDELRKTSPYRRGSGSGHYRSGWRVALQRDRFGIHGMYAYIYNKTKPTLTHLLERGHNLVRGGPLSQGGYIVGWVDAIPHIEHAKNSAVDYLISRGW